MAARSKLRLTPVYLYTDDFRPGPCYVLDPEAWERGDRVVLEVLEPRPEKGARRPQPASTALPSEPTELRRVVTWPVGRPLEWRIEDVAVRRREPAWAARARELRAAGWSIRRIAKELGMSANRRLREILDI